MQCNKDVITWNRQNMKHMKEVGRGRGNHLNCEMFKITSEYSKLWIWQKDLGGSLNSYQLFSEIGSHELNQMFSRNWSSIWFIFSFTYIYIFTYIFFMWNMQKATKMIICTCHVQIYLIVNFIMKLCKWKLYRYLEQARKLQDAQAEKLTSWEAHKPANWQEDKLTSWQIYNWQFDKLTNW